MFGQGLRSWSICGAKLNLGSCCNPTSLRTISGVIAFTTALKQRALARHKIGEAKPNPGARGDLTTSSPVGSANSSTDENGEVYVTTWLSNSDYIKSKQTCECYFASFWVDLKLITA